MEIKDSLNDFLSMRNNLCSQCFYQQNTKLLVWALIIVSLGKDLIEVLKQIVFR